MPMQSVRASPVQTQAVSSGALAPVSTSEASPLQKRLVPAPGMAASVSPPSGTGRFVLDLCSGATRPLSQAAFRNELACFSVDIVLDSSHDLLQDVFYDSMLRWCFSGLFLFALAGPPCGGGPKPLQTPEFRFGVPGLSGRDQQRVEASRTLLQRAVQILLAVFSTGGHVCLEQPSSAFSWQDPSVQDFLAETAAVCSVVPACSFGLNIHASWEHENLVGKRDEWGGFCTQQSTVYPDGLCETIVQIIRPLFPVCEPPFDASVANLSDCVPKKERLIRLMLSRTGQVFIQFRTGLFRLQPLSPCQGVCVAHCFSGSVIIAFLPDFSSMCNRAEIRLFSQRMRLGSFAPSSALGFSQLSALLQWTGQCPRGSRTVSTLCNA